MSRTDHATQTMNTVSLADEERVKQVLVNSVLGLWDVVNNLTRLRLSQRERYRTTIFGSARAVTFGYEKTKRAANADEAIGLIRQDHQIWLSEDR